MSKKPLVSVVVIFLNTEEFIQEAIESVFAQTYDGWELLLVDDGSTDGSTQIALQYAERHPGKVRYLEHPGHQNRGASASRNLGIGHAKGDILAFLDSDDVWLPRKLQQQVAILNSHPEATVLYGNTQYWYSWAENPEDGKRDFVPELVVRSNTVVKPPTLLTINYPLGKGYAPSLSNLVLRREVIERIGWFEESFKRVYTDQVFMSKVYLNEPVFVASESEYWDKYRRHPDSAVSVMRKTGQYHSVRQNFLNWLAEFLYEQGIKDTEVWKLLYDAQLQNHGKQLEKSERSLERVRQKLERSKRSLERERQKAQRLRLRAQRLKLRAQNINRRQAQNWRTSRIRRLSKWVGHLRTRVLGI